MSQNKGRKLLETLSTRTEREQKFVKDETENRQLPILKINLLHRTVCEVDRTDYLNRRIASKNKDNGDKNISSESIFHKFPKSISDKVCLTKNVGSKPFVENIDVHKKRRRENLKGDFSESKKKRSISDGKSQKPHYDIVDSFESNFNKLAKCIRNSDKRIENISSSTRAFKNDILKKNAIVKSSKEKDSNLHDNEKRKRNNFSDSELHKSISEGKQKRRKRNNTSFIRSSKNKVSPISTENVTVQTPFLIERDNNYASSSLYELPEDFLLSSVETNYPSIDLSKPPSLGLDENGRKKYFAAFMKTLNRNEFKTGYFPLLPVHVDNLTDNGLLPLFDLSEEPFFSFDKENDCSSSMPVLSALPLPCDVNHCNTISAVNNKSVNVSKAEAIMKIQNSKQSCNSALQHKINKKQTVSTDKSDVNAQAVFKRSENISECDVNDQVDIKQ